MHVRNVLFVFLVVVALGWFYVQYGSALEEVVDRDPSQPKRPDVATSPGNTKYLIEDRHYQLFDGGFERPLEAGAAATERIRVHGEPSYGDVDNDGDDDAFLILTHEKGGSGTFYHAAFAIYEGGEFIGTNTSLIGDRVTILEHRIGEDRAHLTYLDYADGEPFSAEPTATRTTEFILDAENEMIVEDAL